MFIPDFSQWQSPAGTRPRAAAVARIGEDRPWLMVMAAVTAIELAWWAAVWLMGHAPAPYLLTYIGLSFAGLGSALILRALLYPRAAPPNWWSVIPATLLVAIGASLFLPLKYAIPQIVPFWLDPLLASGERAAFGGEPWLLIDPKPFVGDRSYDATQHLLNCTDRLRTDPLGTIQRFADLLGVDPMRVRLWTFARAAANPRRDWTHDPLADVARRLAP